MKMKILNRKLVKPCIPTPTNLKTYKLSFIDEILPLMEVGVLLYYPSNPKPIHLEQSLSMVLPSFYPLAGRFILSDHIVDCSDQGAEFLEAEAPDTELAALLVERDHKNLSAFLPRENKQVDIAAYPILSIQATSLKCGGLVVGVSISHKIFDVSALSTFLLHWSNTVNPNPDTAAAVTFEGAALFPRRSRSSASSAAIRFLDSDRISVKRFSFSKEAIASLKSSFGAGQRVSRVRAVCALVAEALAALDRAKHGRSRGCLITQAVNMRGRTVPPLSETACGNLVMLSLARCCAGEIQQVADLLGEAVSRSVAECGGILGLDEDRRNEMVMEPLRAAGRAFMSGEENVLTFSDYSKFGFYGVDLGWGKPAWASIAPHTTANTVVVMGSGDGDGIEAWVHLENDDMELFEQNHQIATICTI
ncbi:shikimate O-hydroxycinnamoyltransferase [Salvia divinorum]|uniref:Shikimate O-hydroxycinnamoyltransferase n=1 Tax=Salvia divinorum TaxID=28513 RepID=A0ABD1G6E3_SALDI